MVGIIFFIFCLVCVYYGVRIYYLRSKRNFKNNYVNREGCKEFLNLLSEKYAELFKEIDKKESKADKISSELWQFLNKKHGKQIEQSCPYCYSDNTTKAVVWDEHVKGDDLIVCADCNKEILRESCNIIGRKKLSKIDFYQKSC